MNLKFNKFTILGIIAALVVVGVLVYVIKEVRASRQRQKEHSEAISKIASIMNVTNEKTGKEMGDIKTQLHRVVTSQQVRTEQPIEEDKNEKISVVSTSSKPAVMQRHHEIKDVGDSFNPFDEVTDPDQPNPVGDDDDDLDELSPEKMDAMSRDILD